MKNVFKVTLAYLAAIIGAGFASGSEAVYYFVRFGNLSFAGVVFSSIGFGFVAYVILFECVKLKVNNFESLLNIFCGKKTAVVSGIIMSLFMLILLSAMISAFAEMMYIIAGVPKTLSAAAFSILCFYALCMPKNKIINWGGVCGFFIVIMLVFCALYMLKNRTVNVFNNGTSMISSSAVYTAYNAFAVCPVLCEWSRYLKTKKECVLAGVMSGMGSLVSLTLLWGLISVFYGKIYLGDMPMLTLAARQGHVFMYVYAFVIFVSVLSSAVANGYGICLKFNTGESVGMFIPGVVICLGWLLSSIGFTAIVTGLYEYMGYGIIAFTVYCLIKIKKNDV